MTVIAIVREHATMEKFPSTIRAWALVLALMPATAAGMSPSSAFAEAGRSAPRRLDVQFEATPHAVVDAMLKLAKVGPGDFVIDLGSGDGRIPIAAARRYGARGLGIDIDPRRIRQARANARRQGVVGKVRFAQGDLFKADISKATVITLFLNPRVNRRLRHRLLGLAPGTRIVSHVHDMGDWEPARTIVYRRGRERGRLLLWVVPPR